VSFEIAVVPSRIGAQQPAEGADMWRLVFICDESKTMISIVLNEKDVTDLRDIHLKDASKVVRPKLAIPGNGKR
jgi:hypothetical protein